MLPKYVDGRGEIWSGWMERFIEYGWERKQQDAGDFRFHASDERSVGIEVKSVSDLVSRLPDARRELAQLIDMVDIPILLVFNPWQRKSTDVLIGGNDHVTWAHLWNLLQTYQDSGLRFQMATTREHAFNRINQLFAYYQKPEHTSNLVGRRSSGDRRIASLMAIPGISKKLGARLLSERSLQDVANMETTTLCTIPLIGPSKARTVLDWFRRKEPYR